MKHICERSYGSKPIRSRDFLQTDSVPGSRWVGLWDIGKAKQTDRPPDLSAWVYNILHWDVQQLFYEELEGFFGDGETEDSDHYQEMRLTIPANLIGDMFPFLCIKDLFE